MFLTGGGGCGKSHLLKTVYQLVTKLLLYRSGDLDKPSVLVLAPTGVAAINMNGTTIHSGLKIHCCGKLFPIIDTNRAILRNKYSQVELVIIDEISMVSSKLFFQVHQRLLETFACPTDIPFVGKPVILCGDLYQLLPVCGEPVFIFDESTN